MLSLDALANWEAAVLASIRGASGTIDERDAQITRSGMYAEYPAIFNAYVEPITVDEDRSKLLEVLKRAVFLAWCSFTQIPVETGIAELPESSVRYTIELLEAAIKNDKVDEELRLMLAWYRGVFGYMFDHFGGVRGLDDFIGDISAEDAREQLRRLRAPADFAGRGQLGDYWRTIIAR
jgi:hypothetical protein